MTPGHSPDRGVHQRRAYTQLRPTPFHARAVRACRTLQEAVRASSALAASSPRLTRMPPPPHEVCSSTRRARAAGDVDQARAALRRTAPQHALLDRRRRRGSRRRKCAGRAAARLKSSCMSVRLMTCAQCTRGRSAGMFGRAEGGWGYSSSRGIARPKVQCIPTRASMARASAV